MHDPPCALRAPEQAVDYASLWSRKVRILANYGDAPRFQQAMWRQNARRPEHSTNLELISALMTETSF